MTALRALTARFPLLAALILAATLLARVLVPGGYMLAPAADGHSFTVTVCNGTGPATMEIHVPGKPGSGQDERQKAEAPCAFAGLSHAAIGGADPVQLALAIAFVLAAGFAALVPLGLRLRRRLRPPLRGPPLTA